MKVLIVGMAGSQSAGGQNGCSLHRQGQEIAAPLSHQMGSGRAIAIYEAAIERLRMHQIPSCPFFAFSLIVISRVRPLLAGSSATKIDINVTLED